VPFRLAILVSEADAGGVTVLGSILIVGRFTIFIIMMIGRLPVPIHNNNITVSRRGQVSASLFVNENPLAYKPGSMTWSRPAIEVNTLEE